MKNKYIKSPSEVLAQNEIDLAKAKHEGASNPWVVALQGMSGLMMNAGMNMGSETPGTGGEDTVDAGEEAAYGGVVGNKKGKKDKDKDKDKKLTEEDKKKINESAGVKFTDHSMFEKMSGKDAPEAPTLDFGKYDEVGYFDIVGNQGDAIVIRNTDKNPHNAHTIKQNMRYLQDLNPGKEIKLDFMAYGGVAGGDIPVEAEGGEVVTTTEGQTAELKGPKHEGGGIDLMLGMGDKIFSDRITKDGKTMAEREKARQKNLSKLEKMFEKTPSDTVLKKSLKRTTQNNASEEEADIAAQKAVRQVMELANPPKDEKAAWGFDPSSFVDAVKGMGKGMTGGDLLGMAGNLYSGIAPMLHTKKTRAQDTPNENYYEGFGEDALETVEETKEFARQNNDALRRDISKSANAAKRSGRVGARGISTQRAMDLATEQGANDARGNASSEFANQMMQILGRQGQMENVQDQVVMGGEEKRDMRDRADKDNHASQMSQNIVGFGESIQQTGSDLNDVKQNEIIIKMLDQLSKYGLGFDKEGEVIKKGN